MAEEVVPETTEQLEEELFLQDWIEAGFNATQAYLNRHPDVTPRSAATLGSALLKKIDIKRVLEARNLGYDRYFRHLDEGLEATKVISAIGEANGKSTDFVDVPDYKTRRDYHKALGKALGVEVDKVEHEVGGELVVKTVQYADGNDSSPV